MPDNMDRNVEMNMPEQTESLRLVHSPMKRPLLAVLALLPFAYVELAKMLAPHFFSNLVLVVSIMVSAITVVAAFFLMRISSPLEKLESPYEKLRFHRYILVSGIFLLGCFAHLFAVALPVVAITIAHFDNMDVTLITVPLSWCAVVAALCVVYRLIRPRLLDAQGHVVPDAVVAANVDPHWRWWGYYNPDDPLEMVEMRYGIGVTFNWARRENWVIMGYFLAVVVGQAIIVCILAVIVGLCWRH